MMLSLLLRSLLTDNQPSPEKMGHTTGVNDPTLFEKWCGFFYVPQNQISENDVRGDLGFFVL